MKISNEQINKSVQKAVNEYGVVGMKWGTTKERGELAQKIRGMRKEAYNSAPNDPRDSHRVATQDRIDRLSNIARAYSATNKGSRQLNPHSGFGAMSAYKLSRDNKFWAQKRKATTTTLGRARVTRARNLLKKHINAADQYGRLRFKRSAPAPK